ncbi:unnamed protein product [Phytophthora lilii]|uniref:Unnamed protein product n=1 Tax=Phytophthora lilii TaxID=2077276 RepID=A0A9W6WX06_9STRA|nr:unnamed protein product [Phytophthora lilii]
MKSDRLCSSRRQPGLDPGKMRMESASRFADLTKVFLTSPSRRTQVGHHHGARFTLGKNLAWSLNSTGTWSSLCHFRSLTWLTLAR